MKMMIKPIHPPEFNPARFSVEVGLLTSFVQLQRNEAKRHMKLEFGEHQLAILRGDRRSRQLHKYAPSMADAIKKCGVPFPNNLCMVTAESPSSYKDAVETLGACWLQELKYDIRPFTKWEYRKRDSDGRHFSFRHTPTTDDAARSFLWQNGKPGNFQVFGACTFRLRADSFGHFWGLQWIWFHPAQRRKGHFTMAWPFLRSMFDVFVPEPPLSDDMIMFLRKMDYFTVLQEYAKRRGGEMPV